MINDWADRYHVGRSWSGHELEDGCPCLKAPCGLVEMWVAECPHHAPDAGKTIRQSHPAEECPGVSDGGPELNLGNQPLSPSDGGPVATRRTYRGPCPMCDAVDERESYDIGSGPELCCRECEWCWGAEGQDLNPLAVPSAKATRFALQAHSEGRDVTLSYATGEWTIDGEPVETDEEGDDG